MPASTHAVASSPGGEIGTACAAGVAARTVGGGAFDGVDVRHARAIAIRPASARRGLAGALGANSSSIELPAPIVITPPQTEQRARTPARRNLRRIDAKHRPTLRTRNVHFPSLRGRGCTCDVDRRRFVAATRIRTPIDREDRTGKRLRVALHFGRQRAHLRRVREAPALVRHDADRHRHQWYTVQLSAAILAEEISGAPILLGILKRNQRVEDGHDLGATSFTAASGMMKMKSSPPMWPTNPSSWHRPLTTSCRICARIRMTRSPS